MKGPFLLDTSTVIWALADPDRLSTLARKAVRSGSTVLSVATYWEVVIKAQKGLLRIADPAQWWLRAIELLGAETMAIVAAHITAVSALPPIHKDPFDRILIAQATVEGLSIVTNDAIVVRYPIKALW